MKKILLLLLMLMSVNMIQAREITRPPVETPPPTINVTETEDFYIIEAVGEGEVNLYVNDEPVENPYTIARPEPGEDAIVIYVYATAQNPGQEIGTSDVERIEIDPKDGYFPDPHETGVWIVLRDRYGQEEWKELIYDDGIMTITIMMKYSIYGGYNPESDERPLVPFYLVIDGIRYGAPFPYCPVVIGENNLLSDNNNCFVCEIGYKYFIGVSDLDNGNMILYAGKSPIIYYNEDPTEYITGDADGNAKVSIADVISMIDYMLTGYSTGFNMDNADVNGSGKITIEDVTLLIDYMLKGSWW